MDYKPNFKYSKIKCLLYLLKDKKQNFIKVLNIKNLFLLKQ